MAEHLHAVVKSLIVVAWADGQMHAREAALLDTLFAAFALDAAAVVELREFASQPRTLAEVPTAELSYDDRRLLLHHAVLLTHVDGQQVPSELATVRELATRLAIPALEADEIIDAAARRVKRLPALR